MFDVNEIDVSGLLTFPPPSALPPPSFQPYIVFEFISSKSVNKFRLIQQMPT